MTGKPLFLVHYSIDEKLGAMDILGKKFYLKMVWRSACLAQVFFLPYPYPPHSNRYWVSHCKFWLQHQVTYQLWVNSPCLIKYFCHKIIPIHLQGSIYLFHGIFLLCSILFSSDQFMIGLGYRGVCDSYFIDNHEARHSICILHIDKKTPFLFENDCPIQTSQAYN